MTVILKTLSRNDAQKRVYLHIGTAKTGSSFLQATIAEHHEEFCKEGIYYPRVGRNALFRDSGHHLLPVALMPARWEELSLHIPQESLNTVWDDLLTEISDIEETDIFISSEWFAFDVCDQQQIKKIRCLLSNFDVKIIVVFRDVVDFVNSSYSQRVRDGFNGSVIDYIKLAWPHLNWMSLTDRWARAFGNENVIPMSYAYLRDRNYLWDFCRIAFGREVKLALDNSNKFVYPNHSLSKNATNLILEINNSDIPISEQERIRNDIKTIYDRSSTRHQPSFIDAQLSAILRFVCEWPEVSVA